MYSWKYQILNLDGFVEAVDSSDLSACYSKGQRVGKMDMTVVKQEWAPFEIWGLDELISECSVNEQRQEKGGKTILCKLRPFSSNIGYMALSLCSAWPTIGVWTKEKPPCEVRVAMLAKNTMYTSSSTSCKCPHKRPPLESSYFQRSLLRICLALYLFLLTYFSPYGLILSCG